jgi:hypothetical protein
MLIMRRCIAVMLWLLGWLCASELTGIVTYPISPSRWPPAYNISEVIEISIGFAIVCFSLVLGAVAGGQRLWQGDVTKRWSPPRLVRNCYFFGCSIVLIVCYTKAFLLGAEPSSTDLYVPWVGAIFLTAYLPSSGLFQMAVKPWRRKPD